MFVKNAGTRTAQRLVCRTYFFFVARKVKLNKGSIRECLSGLLFRRSIAVGCEKELLGVVLRVREIADVDRGAVGQIHGLVEISESSATSGFGGLKSAFVLDGTISRIAR